MGIFFHFCKNKIIKKMGFYYDDGFYYNEPEGFYYDQDKGFYYDGFYYDGFYYNQPKGFYYDQSDKFNQDNKDYWYKGDGRKQMLGALNGLTTLVNEHVIKNPHDPNEVQGRALSNVVSTQIVTEVIKKFVANVNPDEFFKNGGDAKKLGILLVKECQELLGPQHDYRKAWRVEGSNAKKAMDKVSGNLIPFMITWYGQQPFHKPNGNQDAACMKLVSSRLVDEVFYEYATKNNPAGIKGDAASQAKQSKAIANGLAEAALKKVKSENKF